MGLPRPLRWCERRGTVLRGSCNAFTLVEILVVILAIGILSGLAISYVGGASEQASTVVARQQQAQLQSALDSWITAQSSGTAGLASAKSLYSTDAEAMLSELAPYLRDPDIFSASAAGVSSGALAKIGRVLQFSAWVEGGYPKVLMP